MAQIQLKDVVLGEGRAKVIVPITGTTADELVDQAVALAPHDLDIVEWRVDDLDVALDPDAVIAAGERIVAALGGRPVLFTFRTAEEGGQQPIDPATYVALNQALIGSGLVDAVDVELL
ncbi:MAG: type I 3-dehydroquinate dehydratase, partial [Propioniciclava sp.]